MVLPVASSQDLAKKAASGALWSTAARIGQQSILLVATIILARLLPPSAYGLLGMATVVIGFVSIFADLGTSAALIQREDLTDGLTSGIFWLNMAFGVMLTTVLIVGAPWVARFYREPQLTSLVIVLSLSISVSSLGAVQQALLMRGMSFRQLACIELGSSVAGAGAAVALAASGAGVWSLVALSLVTAALTTGLLWMASEWRPRPRLAWQEVKSVLAYGLNLSGFGIVNYFSRNADNMLVGRYLGSETLGHYAMAYRIMLYPLQNISWVVGRVLFPVLAQMQQDDGRFRQTYLRVCAMVAAISFPLMLAILVLSGPLVVVVLGSEWMPIAPLLVILAPVGMLQSVGTTVGQIYMAKGRTDWMFRWGLGATAVTVGAFAIGLRWGVTGVAAAYAVVATLLQYPAFAIPFRLIGLPMKDLGIALWPVLMRALIMCGLMMAGRLAMERGGVTDSWIILIVVGTLGAASYAALMFWRRPAVVDDMIEHLWLPQLNAMRGLLLLIRSGG